tara:strand:+ start:396 stop:956 length:561 start_codon:yes stop_codon:yes gene_type:complete
MKKNKLLIIALFIGFIINTNGQNHFKVRSSVNASARVVSLISIKADRAMSFGGLRVLSTEATKVKLRPTDSVREFSSQRAVSEINGSENMSVASIFIVQGEPNSNYKVSLPDNSIEINTTATGLNKTMIVNDFTLSFDNTNVASDLTQQLSSDGINRFTVGATLNIGDSQTMGNYIGSYSIAVDYE